MDKYFCNSCSEFVTGKDRYGADMALDEGVFCSLCGNLLADRPTEILEGYHIVEFNEEKPHEPTEQEIDDYLNNEVDRGVEL